MKRTAIFLFATVLVCACFLVAAYSQEDMEAIDNSVFENPQRTPSVFPHDAHNEAAEIEECNECHHVYEDGKKVEDESSEDQQCSECHGPDDEGGMPSLIKAYHRNCKGCHMTQKNGPIMCGECHKR
jgi:hypothetical protein